MRVIIFAGPTLPKAEILEILPGAIVLPPMEQGDCDFARNVLKADVIGMIDGVHRQRLSEWHKSILITLKSGCRVVGAASMGALRAVECEPFGSEPIGEVARWYKQGQIEADDEVCVAHLGSKYGYRQTSLPLVNIRASLIAAQVGSERQKEIIEAAQDIFYPDRSWKLLFEVCESSHEERKQILDCELDIKAADALHLCYYIQSIQTGVIRPNGQDIQNLPEKPKPEREIKNHNKGYGAVFLGNDRKIWNGRKVLRQHNMAHPQFRDQALNRALALEFCKVAGIAEVAQEIDAVPPDDMDEADFKRIRNEEASLARAREWLSNAGAGFMDVPKILDFMRVNGLYQKVKETIK